MNNNQELQKILQQLEQAIKCRDLQTSKALIYQLTQKKQKLDQNANTLFLYILKKVQDINMSQFAVELFVYLFQQINQKKSILEVLMFLLQQFKQQVKPQVMQQFLQLLKNTDTTTYQCIMILSFQEIKTVQLDKQPITLCQEIHDYQTITRKLPPLDNSTPLLHQILLQTGYLVSSQQQLVALAFRKAKIQKFGINEFSRLFEFLLITDQHPLMQKMTLAQIYNFLGENSQNLQDINGQPQPKTWNANFIFTYIYQTYGQFNIGDILQNIQLPQGYYSPQRFISMVTEAAFSMQQTPCLCSKCSQKQKIYTPFQYLEKHVYNDTVQLNWVMGLYQLIQLVCENLVQLYQRYFQYQNQQQISKQVILITLQHCFYLQISHIQSIVDVLLTKIPELQNYKDKTHIIQPISPEIQQQEIQQLTNAQFLFKNKVFLQAVVRLYDKYPQTIIQIFSPTQIKFNPTIHIPEDFAITLSQLEQVPLVKALISQCLYRNWNKQGGRTKQMCQAIETLLNQQPDAIVFTLITIYYNQPSLLGKIIDTLGDYRLLFQALHSNYLSFSIDLALLAAGRQLINLSLFLSGGLLHNGIAFYETVCLATIKKGINILTQLYPQDPFVQQTSELFDLPNNQGCQTQQLSTTLELAKQRQHVVSSTYEYQLFQTSESIFSESIAVVLYRFLAVSGQQYFQYFLKDTDQLFQRICELQNTALTVIKKVYPRVELEFCYELSICQVKGAKKIDLTDLSIQDVCDILDDKFKSSNILDRCSYNITVFSLIKDVTNQDQVSDSWIILLNMLIRGQLQDIFQQLVINELCRRLSIKKDQMFAQLIQNYLKQLSTKDTFKALNNPLDWTSFYQMIQSTFNINVGNYKQYPEICTLEENKKIAENNGCQQISTQLDQLINDSIEIAQSSLFDQEIKQKFQIQQYKFYTHQSQQYETQKDIFNKILDVQDNDECENLISEQKQQLQTNYKTKNQLYSNQNQVFIVSQFISTQLLPSIDTYNEGRAIYAIMNIYPEQFQPTIVKYAFYTSIRLIYIREGIQIQLSSKIQRRKIVQSLGHLIGCISKQYINIFDKNQINLQILFQIAKQSNTLIILSAFLTSIIEKSDCNILLSLFIYLLNYLNDLSQDLISQMTCEEIIIFQQDLEFIQHKLLNYFNGNYINMLVNTSGIVSLEDVHNCQLNQQLETVEKINLELKQNVFYDQSQQFDVKDQIDEEIVNQMLIENPQLQENLRILAIQSRYVPEIKLIAENNFNFVKQLTQNQIKFMFPDTQNIQTQIQKDMFIRLGQRQLQTINYQKLIKPVTDLIFQQIIEMVNFPKTANQNLIEYILKQLSLSAADLTIKHIVSTQLKQLNLLIQVQQGSNQKYNFTVSINDENDFLTTEASDIQIEFDDNQRGNEKVQENILKILNQFKNLDQNELQIEETNVHLQQQIQEEQALQYGKQVLEILQHKKCNNKVLNDITVKFNKFIESLNHSSQFLKEHFGNTMLNYFLNFISCKAESDVKYQYDNQQQKIVFISPDEDYSLSQIWKKCQNELTQQFKQQFEQFNIFIKPSHSVNFYNKQIMYKIVDFIQLLQKNINMQDYEKQLDICISNSLDACLQTDIVYSSVNSDKSVTYLQNSQYSLSLLLHLKWLISDEKETLLQDYIKQLLESKIKQLLQNTNKFSHSQQFQQLSQTTNAIAQFCYQQIFGIYSNNMILFNNKAQYLNNLIAQNYTEHIKQHFDIPMYTQIYSYTLMSHIKQLLSIIQLGQDEKEFTFTQRLFTNISLIIQIISPLQIKNEFKTDLIKYIIKINKFELNSKTIDQLFYSLIQLKSKYQKSKQGSPNSYLKIFIDILITVISDQSDDQALETLATCLHRLYFVYFFFSNEFILQDEKDRIIQMFQGPDQTGAEIKYTTECQQDTHNKIPIIQEFVLFIYKELFDYLNMRMQVKESKRLHKIVALTFKSLQLYLPQRHSQFVYGLISILSSPNVISLGTYVHNISQHLMLTKWWLTEYDDECWNNYSILLQKLIEYCQKERNNIIQYFAKFLNLLSNNQKSQYFLLKHHFNLYRVTNTNYNLLKRYIVPHNIPKLTIKDLSLLQSSPLTDWKIDMKHQSIIDFQFNKQSAQQIIQQQPKDYAMWYIESVIQFLKKEGSKLTNKQIFIDFKESLQKVPQQTQQEVLSCIGNCITGYNLETFASLTILQCCEKQGIFVDMINKIFIELAVE